ncbi:MAG: diguanylate cyclase [Arcobacteraceae bacterium]|nr:diguanylate cyclase [Arcobacteraceae bacterium]
MNTNTDISKSWITRRYTLALTIIALLCTVAFYTLLSAVKSTNSTAYLVNISGKQRMLSQHIALDVYRFTTKNEISSYELNIIKETLTRDAKEMLHINQILSTGNLLNKKNVTLSPIMKDMYFGDTHLASRVYEYANTALLLICDDKNINRYKIKEFIDKKAEPLLVDLNKAVTQYQIEGEQDLQYIQLLETIVWILTLLTLLLEVIFIFQPMSREIISLGILNDKTLENLENTVELRTLNLENANHKLEHLASHDPLTGLRNRLELEKYIEKAIEHNKQHGAPYAVMMFDIDWFKSVNDTYGHDIGDKVLVEISNIINSSIRENDQAFRAGGEEFVVLLNRINFEDSIKVAQKIRELISKHLFQVDDNEFFKTVSCGLYHSTILNANTVKNLLQLIDTALYQSKTNGRNRLTIVNFTMNTHIEKIVIPKTNIIFFDRTFKNLLEIDTEHICIDTDKLSNEKDFLSWVHKDDLYLLDNLPIEISEEEPYKTTLRLINSDNKIDICRVNIFEREEKKIVINLEHASLLAKKISDATLLIAFQAMLENTNDYIYFKDLNHIFIAASKSLVSLTSVETREELVGKTDYDVFPYEMADEYFKLEREVFDNGVSVAQKLQPTLDKDGNKAWVDNRKYPIYDESGEVIGLFGIARIVSDNGSSS